MIEKGTNYSYKLKALKKLSFESIRKLSVDDVAQMNIEISDELFNELERGVDILQTEGQMTMYMHAYGKMHRAKLMHAFEVLPEFIFKTEIEIIDWGCGQALATMAFADFLNCHNFDAKIKSITLIEPSECCIKRGALHATSLFPTAEIILLNTQIDHLNIASNLQKDENLTKLHFFSNILDINCFDIETLANLMKNKFKNTNYFVCVSPIQNNFRKSRLSNFMNSFSENKQILQQTEDPKFNNQWTLVSKVFTINETKNIEFPSQNEILQYLSTDEFKCLHNVQRLQVRSYIGKKERFVTKVSGEKIATVSADYSEEDEKVFVQYKLENGNIYWCLENKKDNKCDNDDEKIKILKYYKNYRFLKKELNFSDHNCKIEVAKILFNILIDAIINEKKAKTKNERRFVKYKSFENITTNALIEYLIDVLKIAKNNLYPNISFTNNINFIINELEETGFRNLIKYGIEQINIIPNFENFCKFEFDINKKFKSDGEIKDNTTLSEMQNIYFQNEQIAIQNQLVHFILAALEEQRLAKTQEEKIWEDFDSDSNIPFSRIIDYVKVELYGFKEELPQFADNIQQVIDNMSGTKGGFIGFERLIKVGLERLGFKVDYIDDTVKIDDEKGQKTSSDFPDNKNDKIKPETKLSPKIKKILSTIPDVKLITKKNENGEEEVVPRYIKTSLGLTARRDFYKIYNFLAELLSDTPFEEMDYVLNEIATLSHSNSSILANQLLQIFNKMSQEEIFDLYKFFDTENNKFSFMYIKLSPEGFCEDILYETNKNFIADLLINKWKYELIAKKPELIKSIEEETIYWEKEKLEIIKNEFFSFAKNKDSDLKQLCKILESVGITVSLEALTFLSIILKRKYNKNRLIKGMEFDDISLANLLGSTFGLTYLFLALGEDDIFVYEKNLLRIIAKSENKVKVIGHLSR